MFEFFFNMGSSNIFVLVAGKRLCVIGMDYCG